MFARRSAPSLPLWIDFAVDEILPCLPFSNQRIDAVFLGKSEADESQAMVVELKQWSRADIEDEDALNIS